MTKSDIIHFLKAYIQAEEQVMDVESEKLYLEKQIKKRKEIPRTNRGSEESYTFAGIVSSLIVGIFTIPVMAIIFFLTPLDEFLLDLLNSVSFAVNHPFITRILLAYFIPTIIMIPFWCKVCNTSKEDEIKDEKAREQYQKGLAEIPTLEQKLQQIPSKMKSAQNQIQQLRDMNIVHPKYLPYSKTLLSYFEEGRADTLKEAINLLEQSITDWEKELEERRHRREIEKRTAEIAAETSRAADASERAASSAEEAALWGAATTFIVASEADRQRRRDRDNS